jgi:hypothetical protein
MTLYLIIIAVANVIIDLLVSVFTDYLWYNVVFWTALSTLVAFLIDLILAIVIRKLPEKWFNPNKKIFRIFDFEKRLYEFIGVKKFKDHVPELGKYSGFRKNKVTDPKNPEYLYRFMMECCYGEVIHLLSVPIGVIAMFCMPIDLWILSGLPVVIVNAFLCILPYFVLRYNRKKLSNLYRIATKLNQKQLKSA